MKADTFAKLRVGDIVICQATKMAYVITANYHGQLIATSTLYMSTPAAWELFRRRPQARAGKDKP